MSGRKSHTQKGMHKVFLNIGKAIFHVLRYFIFPMFVVGNILFLIGIIISLVMHYPNVDAWAVLISSLTLSIFISGYILAVKTIEKLGSYFFSTTERFSSLRQPLQKISIKLRLKLKPYLFWLFISLMMLSFSLALLSVPYSHGEETDPQAEPIYWAGIVLIFGAVVLYYLYGSVYEEKERALYLLDRFNNDIKSYLKGRNGKPSFKDFREALNSYQRCLPTFFVMKNIKKRAIQIGLVLDRGTKDEIENLREILQNIYVSIKDEDKPSVDQHFNDMIELLDKFQASREKLLEAVITSKKETAKSFLREMVPPILQNVVPYIILVMMAYIAFKIWGHWIF